MTDCSLRVGLLYSVLVVFNVTGRENKVHVAEGLLAIMYAS